MEESHDGILYGNENNGSTTMCNNMEDSYPHDVEQKKPERKKEDILCDSIYMKFKNMQSSSVV